MAVRLFACRAVMGVALIVAPLSIARVIRAAGGKPLGVWQQAGPGATVQIQIRNWNGVSAPAVLYVATIRPARTAIYAGRVTVRTPATFGLSVVVGYTATLPSGYTWCQRLSGTITPTTRSGEKALDFAPLCTDGRGRGIIHHHSGASGASALPGMLLNSAGHTLHLGPTGG